MAGNGGASEKAFTAAVLKVNGAHAAAVLRPEPGLVVYDALAAAHDPALRLARSVCLGDVLEALRSADVYGNVGKPDQVGGVSWREAFVEAANHLEAAFTEGVPDGS